jgi:hypothetical protein
VRGRRCASPGPRRRIESSKGLAGKKPYASTVVLVRGGGGGAGGLLAGERTPPPLRKISTSRADFLLGAAGEARSLRFFRPEITRKLFAIQARMERQFTGTAAPSRPTLPGPAKGRNLATKLDFCGSRGKSPTPRSRVGRGCYTDLEFPEARQDNEREVVLNA